MLSKWISRAIAVLFCLVPVAAGLPSDLLKLQSLPAPLWALVVEGLIGVTFVFGSGGSAWLAGARGIRLVRISLAGGLFTFVVGNVVAAALSSASYFDLMSSSAAGRLLLATTVVLSWVFGVAGKSADDHRHARMSCPACQGEFALTPSLYLRAPRGRYACPVCGGALVTRHRWFYWLWIGSSAFVLAVPGAWAFMTGRWLWLLTVVLAGTFIWLMLDWLMERNYAVLAPRDLIPLPNKRIEQNAAK